MLIDRLGLDKNETLCLKWRGPSPVTKAISNNVFQVEGLRNGSWMKSIYHV